MLLKGLDHATGVDTFDLAAKKDFIAVKAEADKPNINKIVNVPATIGWFHNILGLFDVLPIFPFNTSETMGDYYLQPWYIQVASRVALRLRILGN